MRASRSSRAASTSARHLTRSSKAELSQALTEGTRAGRQLNDLREELRKKRGQSVLRGSDRHAQPGAPAQRGSAKAHRTARSRQAEPSSTRCATRANASRCARALTSKKSGSINCSNRCAVTVQDAEESEPLLAKELYDTVRKAGEQKIPDALKVSQQLVDLGISEDAAKASRHAGQGLEQLREGVERAARSVLGDETAALEASAGRARGPRRPARSRDRPGDRELSRRIGIRDSLADEPRAEGPTAAASGRAATQARRATGSGRNQVSRKAAARRAAGPAATGAAARRATGSWRTARPAGSAAGSAATGKGNNSSSKGSKEVKTSRVSGQAGARRAARAGKDKGSRAARARAASTSGWQSGRMASRRQPGENGAPDTQAAARVEATTVERADELGPGGPIRGEGFRQWSDRMRDVEELLDNPEMRAEAARLRDRVRGEREEYKRHSKEPDWNKLRDLVAEPIDELRKRIAEEVRRRESPDALVPIDRDPVPPQFAEGVRRYYERLGSGK